MPGFTDKERLTIAALCRFHRKSMPQPGHLYFASLDAESKRTVAGLAPLLRIADTLDRGHDQKVRDISSVLKDGNINLLVQADADPHLEIWAANEAARTLREVYGTPVFLQRAKAHKA